jgi:hypothetical protein
MNNQLLTRVLCLVAVTATVSSFALAESAAPGSNACVKNVSFAIAEDGQPVPAVPKFAAKWLGNPSHLTGLTGLCFSQTPSSTLSNYVVIFSSSETMFEGLMPSAHTYTSTTTSAVSTTPPRNYGGTWNYSYQGTPPAKSTATMDLQRDDKPKTLYVRAYNQQGASVAQYQLDALHNKEKTLESVLSSVRAEVATPPQQKPVAAPFSVYYVNCDVDSPPATQTVVQAPPAPPPPVPVQKAPLEQSTIDFWSNPAGADIYFDGAYIGKTPASRIVPPGEHSVVIRKKDFTTWQRKLSLQAGARKIAAYLEQKTLTLD